MSKQVDRRTRIARLFDEATDALKALRLLLVDARSWLSEAREEDAQRKRSAGGKRRGR